MENQIQAYVIITSVFFGIFVLITVYLVVKLKLSQIDLKHSETKLKKFNETLQDVVTEKTHKLRESEKLYKSLYELNKEVLENSPVGIIKLDKDLIIEYENSEMRKILSALSSSHRNIKGMSITELDVFRIIKFDQVFKVLQKGIEFTKEAILKTNSPKYSNVTIKGVPIFEDSNFTGSVILIEDITSRINAEKKLKQSYEKLSKATEDIVQAMAATSEMRDPYTAGHQKKTRELAIAIAEEMEVDQDKLEALKFAGMIFDIGKISVPADILSKPGKINNYELEVVKSHSKVGYDILKKIEFPWSIANIVYQHHERLNGSGYPNHLSNNEILLEAKILAVADVVEAMTSHRPHRAALPIEEALNEIIINKAELYDPDVVDACVRVFKKEKSTSTG